MPPRIKTNRGAILDAAFEVAKKEGLAAVTAQSVSAVLKTSVAPIFREFQTIEALRTATAERVSAFHIAYLQNHPQTDTAFLSYGLAYLHFAKEYPRFFEMLMLPGRISMEERMSGPIAFVVKSVEETGGLSLTQAKELFYHVWIYTHGLAGLIYQGGLDVPEETLKRMLLEAFQAFDNHFKQNLFEKEKR